MDRLNPEWPLRPIENGCRSVDEIQLDPERPNGKLGLDASAAQTFQSDESQIRELFDTNTL
jgi:hypothetical protein